MIRHANSSNSVTFVWKNGKISEFHEVAGETAIAAQANVADEVQVMAMFQKIESELGRATGLINNAGANGGSCRIDKIDPELSLNVF